MKTKIIILSMKDIFITLPLLNRISKDERLDLKKVFFLKERNSFKKKIKILFLLSFKDFFKLVLIFINSILKKKNNFFTNVFLNNVNSYDLINTVNNLSPDIIVCINCPQILSEKTINAIKAPIFNFHPGDLPSFRGVLIPFFLLRQKEKKACISFHKIDKYIDKGQLINKKYISLSKKETFFSVYEKIFLSNESYNFIINSILHDTDIKIDIKDSISNYYNYPSIIEILRFRIGIR